MMAEVVDTEAAGLLSDEGEQDMDGSVDLLVLGDSWAAVDHGWPTLIAHDLKLKTVLNLAQGGTTSDSLRGQVKTLVDAVNYGRCSCGRNTIAVVHTGGNDIQLAMVSQGIITFLLYTALILTTWNRPRFVIYGLMCALIFYIVGAVGTCTFAIFTLGCCISCSRPEDFIIFLILENIQDSIVQLQGLNVKTILLSGLPVATQMPLVMNLKAYVGTVLGAALPCCTVASLHWLIDLLLGVFVSYARHKFQLAVIQLQSMDSSCRILYFDEAHALKELERRIPNFYSVFWSDHVHPGLLGHAELSKLAAGQLRAAGLVEEPELQQRKEATPGRRASKSKKPSLVADLPQAPQAAVKGKLPKSPTK
jgi:hypothetical protein